MRHIFSDYKHLKLKQDALWLGTLTLVTVILWITYAVYSSFAKDYTDPELAKMTIPLNPNLDKVVLQSLSSRYAPGDNFTVLVKNEETITALSFDRSTTETASESAAAE